MVVFLGYWTPSWSFGRLVSIAGVMALTFVAAVVSLGTEDGAREN